MTITAQTNLAELARRSKAATRSVLTRFAIIHCDGCTVPEQTIEQVAVAHKLPVALILNALQAEVGATLASPGEA
jgi:hypothetical protein